MKASSVQKYINKLFMLVMVIVIWHVNGDGGDVVKGGGGGGDGDGVDCDMVGVRLVQASFISECANCVADRV